MCERARLLSQPSEMTGHGMFHIILLKLFLKLFLNIYVHRIKTIMTSLILDHVAKAFLYLGVSTERQI
jgi:hypothetical protein